MKIEQNNFSIRRAGYPDLPTINHIYYHSKGYWGYDKKFLDAYMAAYRIDKNYLDQNVVYLLLMNNTILGYYGFYFEEDNSIDLDHFFLLPEFIGKGHGRTLWDFACKTARDLNRNEFSLWSEPGAEAFYLKMGCKTVGMKASEFLNEQPSPIMKFYF